MPAQRLTFPGSTYLAGGTYDPQGGLLTVEFKSGAVTQHTEVPPDIVSALQSGGGTYYRRVLYGAYNAQNI